MKLQATLNRINEENNSSLQSFGGAKRSGPDPFKMLNNTLSISGEGSGESREITPRQPDLRRMQRQILAAAKGQMANVSELKPGPSARQQSDLAVQIKEYPETPKESLNPHPFELNDDDELASQHLEYVEQHLKQYEERRHSSMASNKSPIKKAEQRDDTTLEINSATAPQSPVGDVSTSIR